MAATLLLATVLASQAVLRVQGSGYLQVGFFLYEFRHEPSTLPADITGLPLPPLPSTPAVTSPAPDHDVIGDVTPWTVRTLLPKQKSGGRERGGLTEGSRHGQRRRGGGEAAAGSSSLLWSETSPCNETSSPRPQYRFLLCLDYLYSQPGEAPCRLGKVELSTLSHLGALGRDLVTFPSALGVTSNGSVTSNPIVFGFDSWKGAVRLKVYVRCCGVTADRRAQCEESFSYSIHQKPASFSLSLSPENVMMSGRGRLVLSLMLQCDEDFHGDQCQSYCRITAPDNGHAFCNLTSGKKQCISGWQGPDCQTDVDECRHRYCQNGAHCVNSPPGSFTCQCPLGFVGRRCQRRAPVCHTIPCKNGGSCQDTPFGFVCFCPYGYAGYRCERQLRVIGDNSSDSGSLNVGKTTGSDDRYFAISWESWYSGLLIGGFFFIALVIVICCLLRGRLFRCGITANGSFYSLFISTKTNDDGDLPPDQRTDSVMTDGSMDSLHTYQNIFSVDRKHSYPSMTSHRRSQEEAPRPTSSEELSVRYLSQLPNCSPAFQDMCHYVNVGACSTADGDLEGLPNLVDPRKSPLLIHRDLSSQATIAERKSMPNKRPSPVPIRRPLSEKAAEIPKVMVTQHFKPPPASGCQVDSSRSLSSNSPESVRGEPRVKPSSSRKSLIRGRARDVYTIGGSLSVEDLTGSGSPKPAARKSLLGSIPGRKKGSQPRLCSIRRMDSGGYEIPLKYQSAASLRNQYASLRHSRMDEHVYNELHCPTPDAATVGRRRPGDGQVPQQHAPPRGKPRKRSPFLTVDQRTSLFSETACYVDLTEHVPSESALQEEEEVGEGSACRTSQVASEAASTGTRRKVRAARTRIGTVQRVRKTRRQPSQRPLTQDTARRGVRGVAGRDRPAFEEGGGASVPAMRAGEEEEEEEDSDDVDYEELFNADTDDNDDMYSDCDYTDVFARHNVAV